MGNIVNQNFLFYNVLYATYWVFGENVWQMSSLVKLKPSKQRCSLQHSTPVCRNLHYLFGQVLSSPYIPTVWSVKLHELYKYRNIVFLLLIRV